MRERLRESKEAFSAVFSNPALRLVELSWTLTTTAYWVFIVALSLFAYEEGGVAAVGVVGLIRVLPSVVAAPFAALLGDRYPRHRVLFLVNVVRTALILVAAAVALLDVHVAAIYALTGLVGLMQSIFRPTQAALLPALARSPQELTAANLVLTTIESIGLFLGPAVGGVMLALTGTDAVFVASAIAFLLSALLLAGVRPEREPERAPLKAGLLRESFAGFSTIARDSRLRLIVGLYGAQTLVAGALNVLLVVVALELLDLGEAGIGFLNSAVGVGGLVGGFLALALLGRNKLASDFAVGLVLWGVPIALIGIFPEPALALVLLGVVGIGVTLVDVAGLTLLQRAVPDEVMTRVFGVVQSVFVGTLGLGAIIAPLLIKLFDVRGALIASGSLLPALALIFWRRLLAVDGDTLAPAELALLRRLPLFRSLPPATLDQLAASLIVVTASNGDAIVRQGDSGDRFYVIAKGEVDVWTDGRHVSTLGTGDYFGEIALLRNVPRTATVTAKSDVELYALERDEFLGAVTGHAESVEAADAVIAARLAGLRPGVASV
ncbi:MAG: MFS transporter [Actinobacteria bacterium]|nr:MFS transporter [Actinomycetota bacterium]